MTDRSANWITSYIVNRFERVITGSLTTSAVKIELERMTGLVSAKRKAAALIKSAQQDLKLAATKRP